MGRRAALAEPKKKKKKKKIYMGCAAALKIWRAEHTTEKGLRNSNVGPSGCLIKLIPH